MVSTPLSCGGCFEHRRSCSRSIKVHPRNCGGEVVSTSHQGLLDACRVHAGPMSGARKRRIHVLAHSSNPGSCQVRRR